MTHHVKYFIFRRSCPVVCSDPRSRVEQKPVKNKITGIRSYAPQVVVNKTKLIFHSVFINKLLYFLFTVHVAWF